MQKRLGLIAAVVSFGAVSFADDLKAGVALFPRLLQPVADRHVDDAEGADGAFRGTARAPWAVAGNVLAASHEHGREGGEGGEGGEGKYKHREGGEGGEGGEGRYRHHPPLIHGTLPPIRLRCGSGEVVGGAVGAAAGGLIGSKIGKGDGQLAAVAAGTLLGLLLGREIGAALDASDYACSEAAAHRAGTVPIGTPVVWRNPDTGNTGTFTPLREDRISGTGQLCREYQTSVVIGGRTEKAHGTACRQPDGAWKIVQ